MSRIRNAGVSFFLFLVLLCASMGIASARTSSARQINSVQESAVVGGNPDCDFAHGVVIGLGIAGLFGCPPCEAGALAIEIGAWYFCS